MANGSPPQSGPKTIGLLDAGSSRDTGTADQGNGFEATVGYVEFLGSFARVELDSAGERLLMDLPIAQVQRFGLAQGSAVRALVPRDSVRIYPGAPPDD